MSSTLSPRSRKYSATLMAVSGARRRIMALSSLVATTATDLAMPCGPIVSSRNSRTSRPRSPTSAITTVSNASALASMDRSVDLPTPEPAKTPSRCPWQSGVKMSMTRTPVRNASETRCRCMAGGVTGAKPEAGGPPAGAGFPSAGRPSASTTLPRQEGAGARSSCPRLNTASPRPTEPASSYGATRTPSCVMRTTSPAPAMPPLRLRRDTRSPSRAVSDRPRTP